ncbi:MAG: NfeD family protein [Scytolyngbya sp. HA4215-MV1]|jgi:hypothetical protein|nr:NfeD family protein [Scytolyngbya sp. HA4215-MV1]
MKKFKLVNFFSFFLSGHRNKSTQHCALKSPSGQELSLMEREAIITVTIAPHKSGEIKFQGTWWSARCEQKVTLLPGETVYVTNRQNTTLWVEPPPGKAPSILEETAYHLTYSLQCDRAVEMGKVLTSDRQEEAAPIFNFAWEAKAVNQIDSTCLRQDQV